MWRRSGVLRPKQPPHGLHAASTPPSIKDSVIDAERRQRSAAVLGEEQ